VPPDGKLEAVRGFVAAGPTVMVGDGTNNDAPALAAADLRIAMGSGTARAIEAADVVIADEDLRAVETVFDLATGTRRRIRENVAWALVVTTRWRFRSRSRARSIRSSQHWRWPPAAVSS